jgi:hypothetical protein
VSKITIWLIGITRFPNRRAYSNSIKQYGDVIQRGAMGDSVMGRFNPVINALGVVIPIRDIDFIEPAIMIRQFELLVQPPNKTQTFSPPVGDESLPLS